MRSLLFVVAVLAIGCKQRSDPPKDTGSGSGSGPAFKDARQPIELPKLSGKPPKRTTAELTRRELDAIAAVDGTPSFEKTIRTHTDQVLLVDYLTKERPKLRATVLVTSCKVPPKCEPLELPHWPRDRLLQTISPPLRDDPGFTFEVGVAEIEGGATAIYTYALGYLKEKGQTQYAHGYALYFNDGINQIRVGTTFADDDLGSVAALKRVAPREHLEKIGRAFLDHYVQSWTK